MPNTIPTQTPLCFTSAGPVQVWVNVGTANAYDYLGDTRNGVRITEQGIFAELKSDVSGGEQGPFSDQQLLGEIHQIELDLARYSEAIFALCESRVNPINGASPLARTKGMLIGCAGGTFSVVLISVNFARKYTKCFIVEAISRDPIGMAVMYPRMTFTAIEDTGNSSTGSSYSPYPGCPWTANISVSGNVVT